MIQRLVLILLLWCLSSLKVVAQPLILDSTQAAIELKPYLQVLADKEAPLKLHDLITNQTVHQWQSPINQSGSWSAGWVRFELINKAANNPYWYLQLQDVEAQALEVYVLALGLNVIPQALSAIQGLRPATLRLDLPLNQPYVVYWRVKNTHPSFNFNFHLFNPDRLIRSVAKKDVVSDYLPLLGFAWFVIASSALGILYCAKLPEAKRLSWAFSVIWVFSLPILGFGLGVIELSEGALNMLLLGLLVWMVFVLLKQSRRTRVLGEQVQQIEASNKAKEALFMTMSHELRTPLQAIVSSATLLQQTSLNPQQTDYLEKLQAAAQHMLSLMNNILDVARINHTQPTIKAQPFTLQAVVSNLEKLVGDRARRKGLSFNVTSTYPLDSLLIGDAMRLSQVLLNLLDNAVKFTDIGSVSLSIKPIKQGVKKIDLVFSVVDSGLGLSIKEQAHLFEPFFQADSSINRHYGGTGLGLVISHNLVKHLGGELQVESKLGQGSNFFFKLSFETVAQKHISSTNASLTDNYQNKTLLLVDDDPLNQLFGKELLAALGVKVELASSGAAAISRLKLTAYDLVFMDINMPSLDGYQTTQIIRHELGFRTLPIIALTAHAIAGERERCLAAGMNDYLPKPFSIQELEAVLIYWLIQKDK